MGFYQKSNITTIPTIQAQITLQPEEVLDRMVSESQISFDFFVNVLIGLIALGALVSVLVYAIKGE